ncbi:hypothetical protein Daura_33230 [Dactylosporangium aurantiacum]|uniref:Uncharacterized protein n=1 Tax=Dactylosporangium aurantiacum TaxID=35754 RepID=A0A9Q9I8Y9_9ACTN|nr:hypothetical protein [Dactylosporangium aurantiacum]MDG6105057.1 hypothetical protein [Dactylosporangium aurantiacum]UWZ51587.1 hypothetical protein Daura_33230 [Dactylosporangium aurantiacum]
MPRKALRDLVRTLLQRRLAGAARVDGFAVRLDWPGYGPVLVCHDLTQFTRSLERARRQAVKAERYWSRGPLPPLAVTVVPIDHATFSTHPRECPSTACPTTAALLGTDAAGRNLTRSP